MNDNIIGACFKVGIVVETKVGFSKVRFEDLDDLTTQWLAVNFDFTTGDKQAYALKLNSHVNCLMDSNLEDGCIIGARYSDADTPPTGDTGVYVREFADGSRFEYNQSSGVMTLKAPTVVIDAAQTNCTGALTVGGLLTYKGGMSGSGGSGAAATISGNVQVSGTVKADDFI